MSDRAIVFIDGSNWYHSLKEAGISAPGDVDIAKLSRKLIGPAREWLSSRYYTGSVNLRAEFDAQSARLTAEFRGGLADLRTEMRTGFADLRAEMVTGLADGRTGHADLRAELRVEIHQESIKLIRWMFGFWVMTVLTIAGLKIL